MAVGMCTREAGRLTLKDRRKELLGVGGKADELNE